MSEFTITRISTFIPHFQSEIASKGWKVAFENFKMSVQNKLRNLFIQENADRQMVQIIYLHPRITAAWTTDLIRERQSYHNHQSVCFHIPSGRIVHFSGPKSYGYTSQEAQKFVSDMVFYAPNKQLRVTQFNQGTQFTASWFQDEWVLGGRLMIRANECKFGRETSLIEEFVQVLSTYGKTLADLNKSYQYTFNLITNAYSFTEVAAKLYLVGCHALADQSAVNLEDSDVVGERYSSNLYSPANVEELTQIVQSICNESIKTENVLKVYEDTLQLPMCSHVEVIAENGLVEFVADIDTAVGEFVYQFSKESKRDQTMKQYFQETPLPIASQIRTAYQRRQALLKKELLKRYAETLLRIRQQESQLLQDFQKEATKLFESPSQASSDLHNTIEETLATLAQ